MRPRFLALLASGSLILALSARAQQTAPDDWESPYPTPPSSPPAPGAAKQGDATPPEVEPAETEPAGTAAPGPTPRTSPDAPASQPSAPAPPEAPASPASAGPAEADPVPHDASIAVPSAAPTPVTAPASLPEEDQPVEEAVVISTQERFLPGSEPHSPGTWGRAVTDPRNLRQVPGAAGALGLWRVGSAELGTGGLLRFSVSGEYFSIRNFPVQTAVNVRSAGTFAVSYVPLSFLEAYLAYGATANTNSRTSPRLIEALGDLALGARATWMWRPGLFAGLDLRLLSYAGVGNQDVRAYALGFAPSLLVTYDFRALAPHLPLRAHLNAGYVFDGTRNLVRQHQLTAGEEFALGINMYDRVLAGVALEVPLPAVTPFVEYTLGVPVGVASLESPDATLVRVAEAMPQKIGLGLRVTAFRDVTLTAGGEIGLTPRVGLGVPATPPYNLLLAASFTVDPVARGTTRLVETVRERVREPAAVAPRTARVEGVVLDAASGEPVPGVIVTMVGTGLPPVATDAGTGRFLTHELPHGPLRLQASKDGYRMASRELVLGPGERAPLELVLERVARKARLLISVVSGKKLVAATVQLRGAQDQQVPVPDSAREPVPLEVPAGHYQVSVTAPGYLAQAREVQVSEDAELPIQFDLQPEPKKKLVIVREKKIEILQQVHFATGKATILPSSAPLLAQVVHAIIQNDLRKIRIEGHTDNRGGKNVNLKLSQDRAASVADWLVKAGIERSRLETAGYGDSRPVAPNMTARGRELNRRVEFLIIER